MASNLIEVDESVARAMRDECVDGRMSLLDDLRGGIHARAVLSELNHARNAKHRGEHAPMRGGCEMRLTHVMHGAGFHQLALEEGTYECWDDEDFTNWGPRKAADVQVKHVPRRTIVQGFAFNRSTRLNPSLPPPL